MASGRCSHSFPSRPTAASALIRSLSGDRIFENHLLCEVAEIAEEEVEYRKGPGGSVDQPAVEQGEEGGLVIVARLGGQLGASPSK